MLTGNKSARLTTDELQQVKHLMGAVLTLLAFWSLLSLDVQSGWLIVPAMLALVLALLRPRAVSRIPAATWRIAGPLLLVIIGLDLALHVPDFIPSLVRMMVWILLYRNFAPRRQREDLQLILLCLFCLVLSGVMTVSLLFACQILLFTPLTMALLFVINLLDCGQPAEESQPGWSHFKWRHLLRRVYQVLDWRVLVLGTLLFGFVVLASTLLFILTPRFDLNQALPFMRLQGQAMTGFNEEVRLGDVTSVQNDNSVALRIDVPSRTALEGQSYWRMLVLDRYAAGRFSLSESLSRSPAREVLNERELRSHRLPDGQRRGALWTFYLEGGVSRYLPVPGDYGVLRFQQPQEIELFREVHLHRLDQVGQSVFSYQIEDLQFNQRFPASEEEWRQLAAPYASGQSVGRDYPQTTRALELSAADRSVLAGINASLDGAAAGLTASSYSETLVAFLRDRFDYSLEPDGQVGVSAGDSGSDPVVNWLRSGSRGHCEFFAGAFVLLAREAGFPARMVVGFNGGRWNSVENYFVVRNRNAHAWVEIFDADTRDWLRVDPTPGSGSGGAAMELAGSFGSETGWAAWVDSLRILWYRRIVNFEQSDQVELAHSLQVLAKDFSSQITAWLQETLTQLKVWIAQPFSMGMLQPVLLVLSLLVCLYALWCVRYQLMSLIFRLLRRPQALDPVRRQASRYLQRLSVMQGDGSLSAALKLDLQNLRFGPEVSPERARPVFRRAQQALRLRYRNTRDAAQ